MLLDFAFLGNTVVLLLMASVQFGWLEDLFEEEVEDAPDTPLGLPEDRFVDPLYDAALYAGVTDGSPADDSILGHDPGPDGALGQAYFLGAGNDFLDATGGADYAQGGSGADRLLMRDGDDLVLGGSGDDALFGGPGDDRLYGGPDNDNLDGSTGADALFGNDGDDVLSGGRDDDVLSGGAGNDVLSGDRFDGSGGIERGIDHLDGGDGDDVLWLFGNDSGTGGDGADQFRVMDANDEETLVTITDFEAAADQIEVVYSEQDGLPAPEVTISTDPDTNDASILLDGAPVVRLPGGTDLVAEDVLLTAA